MRYNLFLDDFRVPQDAFHYTKVVEYMKLDWVIARSFDEFVKIITEGHAKGEWPELISYDHDLADDHYQHLTVGIPYDEFTEKTGYHCAKWLIDFCLDNSAVMPNFMVHSMNPAGGDNIRKLLENFHKIHNVTRTIPLIMPTPMHGPKGIVYPTDYNTKNDEHI